MGAWCPKHVEKVCSNKNSASCCITSVFYLTLSFTHIYHRRSMWWGGGLAGQRLFPCNLPPGNSPTIHCTGDSVGPRTDLDGWGTEKNTLRPPRFQYRSPRSAASHYTYATAACMLICSSKFSSVGGLSFEQHLLWNVVAFTCLVHVTFPHLYAFV
jgi:hypothetical protein